MRKSIIILTMTLALVACGGSVQEGPSGSSAGGDLDKIQIVTTVGMLADAAREIGSDRVEVTALMGPGVDPHLYRASEGDVARMMNAQVILYVGLHLEGKMTDVLARMAKGSKRVLAVGEALPPEAIMTTGQGDAQDPHIWFDVALWTRALEPVAALLEEIDPDHAEGYQERWKRYRAELMDVHGHVQSLTARIPEEQRILITAHDAFGYFGKAYGFDVRGLQGISTATEAGTGDVQELAAFITERRIPAIFIESSVSSRSIEAVQAAVEEKGFRVAIGKELFSDALGSAGTPAGHYLGMVVHNIGAIAEALGTEKLHE